MHVQNANETRPDRLELSWVEVRDDRGRSLIEARWTLVPRPVTDGSVRAA